MIRPDIEMVNQATATYLDFPLMFQGADMVIAQCFEFSPGTLEVSYLLLDSGGHSFLLVCQELRASVEEDIEVHPRLLELLCNAPKNILLLFYVRNCCRLLCGCD